jgi:hypothetical protein
LYPDDDAGNILPHDQSFPAVAARSHLPYGLFCFRFFHQRQMRASAVSAGEPFFLIVCWRLEIGDWFFCRIENFSG